MSFTFGNTPGTSFGGTPAKPTGFGTPLAFGTPATTTSTGFGGFGTSTFGTATQQPQTGFSSTFGTPAAGATAPSFGASNFGQPTATVAPTFGSGFGTATTSAAPTFGSTFGTPASTGSSLFGSTSKPSLFGTQTGTTGLFSTPASTGTGLFGTTTSSAGGLFGAPTSTPGTGLFGTGTATSTAPFGSSFGATTTSTPSLFGATPSLGLGTGTGLFGSTPATTQSSLFGGFGTTTTSAGGFGGFSGFGTTTSTAGGGLFGSAFGVKSATSTTVTAQPVAAPPQDATQQALASFYAINIFGDERDEVLKKWNMLQACWGTGKGYYSQSQPPVEYNHCNPFYRFKAIGYVVIPERDNSEGLVKMTFNKKESELSNQRDVLINGIGGIMGNKPNLTVNIELLKAVSDTQTEVMISVSEKGVTGSSRKIPASDLSAFLNQQMQKQQLSNVGVTCIAAYMTPTKAQLEDYLKNPPSGVDPQMWQAAQLDNPNPKQYIPIPINGFADLKKRVLCEEYETGLHRAFLEKVNNEILDLKKKHAASVAQITEQKQKFLQLQHRLLKILVKQEITRKIGVSLQPEEEKLRERLEMMNSIIGVPTQFKGQIKELIANVRIMGALKIQTGEQYKMEPGVQEDIKQFLKMEQNGISHLVEIINNDLRDLKIISEGMNQILQAKQ